MNLSLFVFQNLTHEMPCFLKKSFSNILIQIAFRTSLVCVNWLIKTSAQSANFIFKQHATHMLRLIINHYGINVIIAFVLLFSSKEGTKTKQMLLGKSENNTSCTRVFP